VDKTLEIIKEKINEKQAQLAHAVGGGSAKDYAEYRAICGEIRGLSIAEGFILDLADQMERNDDE
jgi:glycerol dehydrogenase-like iron-containing ADH family enzyme